MIFYDFVEITINIFDSFTDNIVTFCSVQTSSYYYLVIIFILQYLSNFCEHVGE